MKRFFAFPLVRLVAIVGLFAALLALVLVPLRAAHTSFIVVGWIAAALALAAMIVVERLTVGRGPAAIGLNPQHALRDLSAGVLLGAAMFSSVVLVLALAGFYRIVTVHVTRDLGVALLILVPGAIFEEVLFRGVLFRLVEEWAGTWIALAVSALAFGLIHGANPGATWLSSAAIALEAGVLLAAAFVVTRNLWFPIAVHFAWNFCEGPLYGTQISGREFGVGLIEAHLAGPSWMTGGAFGPEAGLPAMVVGTVVAIALLVYAQRHAPYQRRRGQISDSGATGSLQR
ncbi:MAG: CPBP family intramembrane metalloprotease [Candidatus Eremiobacteraeota bacterium]|nr:CPBP family intramembrane metalloprotease [Candidatus Eremiobacteraeota bacterium]